jgi:hypothetical protein
MTITLAGYIAPGCDGDPADADLEPAAPRYRAHPYALSEAPVLRPSRRQPHQRLRQSVPRYRLHAPGLPG